jgi:hypothetical protein
MRASAPRSPRAPCQAHADPWVGWCELDGGGWVIKELSPYEADLDWDDVTELDDMLPLVADLGKATAKIHCVSDEGSEHPLVDVNVEAKITEVIATAPTSSRLIWRALAPSTVRSHARTTVASSTPFATG